MFKGISNLFTRTKKPATVVGTALQIVHVYEYLFNETPHWQMDTQAQLGKILYNFSDHRRIQTLLSSVPETGVFTEAYLHSLIRGADPELHRN